MAPMPSGTNRTLPEGSRVIAVLPTGGDGEPVTVYAKLRDPRGKQRGEQVCTTEFQLKQASVIPHGLNWISVEFGPVG
jgi:hypothetical protein